MGDTRKKRHTRDEPRLARQLFQRGLAFTGEGLYAEAAAAYHEVLTLRPRNQPAWFNLGLVYKRLHRWPESLRCNQRAAELDPKDEAAWWNMGIAATALRDWRAARAAWRGFGLKVPDGDGPIVADYGITCVRLNPDGSGEVVWCDRVDPARAIVRNVPLPESGHRWGDCVLHDGEPKGQRLAGGRRYPVFDELERWEASATPTFGVEAVAPAPEDAAALTALFEAHGLAAEDWTRSIRRLCRACSEGTPCEQHGAPADSGEWDPERAFGLAAPRETAEALLARWAAQSPGRRYEALELVA